MVSNRVRIAISAPTPELAALLPGKVELEGKTFRLTVAKTRELTQSDRDKIWDLLEQNMRTLYESSSFGWDPPEKRKELFHALSRFLLIHSDDSGESGVADMARNLVGYSMFRFDDEDDEDVVYCYELQLASSARRLGLGRFLLTQLSALGKRWRMTKVMLTALKANTPAKRFYESTGFELDPTSPEYEWSEGETDGSETRQENEVKEEFDYEILSLSL